LVFAKRCSVFRAFFRQSRLDYVFEARGKPGSRRKHTAGKHSVQLLLHFMQLRDALRLGFHEAIIPQSGHRLQQVLASFGVSRMHLCGA
jgi:hypothetical protein